MLRASSRARSSACACGSGRGATERRLRLAELVLQRLQVGADLALEVLGVALRHAGADERTGVADLVADAIVAQAAGRFAHPARRVAFVAAHVGGGADRSASRARVTFCSSSPLRSTSCCTCSRLRLRRRRQPAHFVGDRLLLAGDLLGAAHGVVDVAFGAAGLRRAAAAARPAAAARALRPTGRRRPARRWRRRGAWRRPPAAAAAPTARGRRGSPRATSCSSCRAASSACSASSRCELPDAAARLLLPGGGAPPLTLGFLFLPARQLLQLLGELVDLLVGLLLRRLLAHLVLVGHAVHFELEQIGEIAVLLLAAATAAAALLLPDLHLGLVLLLGLLQELQRLLLGRQRRVRRGRLQLRLRPSFISAIAFGSSSRIFLNDAIAAEPLGHLQHQLLDLLAQLRLRQPDDGGVLAQLVGGHRLAIALHVERRGDDLLLLLRQIVRASSSCWPCRRHRRRSPATAPAGSPCSADGSRTK